MLKNMRFEPKAYWIFEVDMFGREIILKQHLFIITVLRIMNIVSIA